MATVISELLMDERSSNYEKLSIYLQNKYSDSKGIYKDGPYKIEIDLTDGDSYYQFFYQGKEIGTYSVWDWDPPIVRVNDKEVQHLDNIVDALEFFLNYTG